MQEFTSKDMFLLQDKLRQKNKTLSLAESCTGGLVASKITSISGSSDIFKGSIVTYSNHIKNKCLNVSEASLEKHGAVSKEVVSAMMLGAKDMFEADYVLALSGVAGPNGGSKEKPLGMVVIGLFYEDKEIINDYYFKGDRKSIQEESANTALGILFEVLK